MLLYTVQQDDFCQKFNRWNVCFLASCIPISSALSKKPQDQILDRKYQARAITFLCVHLTGDSNAESTVAALHPVQQMALAMAEALAAGKSSQGMSQTKHDQIRSSSHDSLAVASSLTQIVHQMQLDFQTSMANITRALVSMDERMTRAEANLIQMEERITRKLDKIQVQMLPLE